MPIADDLQERLDGAIRFWIAEAEATAVSLRDLRIIELHLVDPVPVLGGVIRIDHVMAALTILLVAHVAYGVHDLLVFDGRVTLGVWEIEGQDVRLDRGDLLRGLCLKVTVA